MWFFIGLLVFIVGVITQYFALNRIAFGRSVFLTVAMFVVGFMIWLSPHEIAKYLADFFFLSAWVFLLFMTMNSVLRAVYKKKKLTDLNP